MHLLRNRGYYHIFWNRFAFCNYLENRNYKNLFRLNYWKAWKNRLSIKESSSLIQSDRYEKFSSSDILIESRSLFDNIIKSYHFLLILDLTRWNFHEIKSPIWIEISKSQSMYRYDEWIFSSDSLKFHNGFYKKYISWYWILKVNSCFGEVFKILSLLISITFLIPIILYPRSISWQRKFQDSWNWSKCIFPSCKYEWFYQHQEKSKRENCLSILMIYSFSCLVIFIS